MTNVLNKYNNFRIFLMSDAGVLPNFLMACFFSVLLAITSQVKIYLGFTPVPINLATLTVCASAITLGGYWSFISVALFLFAGAFGLPVFASTNVLGATTGYLLGYAICAFVLGKYSEDRKESIVKTSLVLFLAQVLIVHICGVLGLYIWSRYADLNYTLLEAIMKGSVPFLIGDAIKAIATSYVSALIIKK